MNANTEQDIQSIMMELMKALATLAPHPSNPDYTGPIFTDIDSQFIPPAEYEGMGGSIMFDGLLGMAFSEVASVMNGLEVASHYHQDRAPQKPFALGQKRVLGQSFNLEARKDAMMKAYMSDLPQRKAIERSLAHYQRFYYSMQKRAQMGLAA